MMDSLELKAFLEVRLQLPAPHEYDGELLIVTMGAEPAPAYSTIHIHNAADTYVFVFQKAQLTEGYPTEWVCLSNDVQKVIYQNHIFAIETLLKLTQELINPK